MLELPYQSYVAWRTCITVFHAVAILSTLIRIRTRYKSRQMWLDDYLVMIPMAADFVFCISPWAIPSLTPDPRKTGYFDLDKLWATLLLCYIIIWFSRICFMFSLARIFPPGNPTRSLIFALVFLFALLFSCAALLLAFHCEPFNSADRHCVKFLGPDPATKYTYAADAISDIIMIITPLAVLWRVKLPKLEKRVILAALLGGIMTLLLFVILIFFTYGPVHKYGLPYTIVTTMISNLVAAASLLSSNALVVVTTIYRVYRRKIGQARSSETITDNSSAPTGRAPSSAPAFDLEKTKEDANHRSPQTSYSPTLDTTFYGATDSEGSAAPLSMFTLTQITMEDYDSQHSPPDSTNPRSRLSELPDSSARGASVPFQSHELAASLFFEATTQRSSLLASPTISTIQAQKTGHLNRYPPPVIMILEIAPQSYVAWRTSLLSSNALVIVTTTFREYRRRQTRSEEAELGREALKPKSELSSTRRTDPSQESGTSFELENTNQNTNHRTLASYTFYYIHSSRGRSAGSRSADRSPSQTPSPAYSLTDISMEEFDSQNRPPDLYYSSQLSDASFTPNQQCQQPAPLNHCPPHSSTQSARVV
ncbi:hypothetical protein D9619_004497 [Psilocybe cf. subviscida]|uniref:Rhodopsin domain-containing protein n=1 Tax=Psilocybe cf. subviscida TaxID=2480587 RepID=A0A8H5BNL0_9AGAR|nr:hypothetical protein D9619_004497 [Psilocybe cf. subviscida]